MNGKKVKELKKFISIQFPHRVGDKTFFKKVKKRYKEQ